MNVEVKDDYRGRTWNALNAEYRPFEGEINDEPSMTVPDLEMSLREIFENFAQGIPVMGKTEPLFDDDDDQMGINPRILDEIDKRDMLSFSKDSVMRFKQKIADYEKEVKEAEKQQKEAEKAAEKTPDTNIS